MARECGNVLSVVRVGMMSMEQVIVLAKWRGAKMIDDVVGQSVSPHAKTEVLYQVLCPGYKSDTYSQESHSWLKTGPVHPRSSYMCPDCMKAWRKQY